MPSYNWSGVNSSVYNLSSNWIQNIVPTSSDIAIFGQAAALFDVTFSDSIHCGTWNFTSAADYTFTTDTNLWFFGAGISTATGSVTITVQANTSAWLRFENASSAGGADIINNQSVEFRGTSTAANSTITSYFASGGSLTFKEGSTAANADITNVGGLMSFSGTATAADATIENSATLAHNGSLQFYTASTAGNAIITNNAAPPDTVLRTPHILFFNTSTAGNAVIVNDGNITLNEQSSLGDATITNTGGIYFYTQSGAETAAITNDGSISFGGTSSAEAAQITNNGSVNLSGSASAGSATIVNNGTFLDGMAFRDTSTAGNATITGNGEIDFTGQSSAGSATITGNGAILFLGFSTAGSAKFTVGNRLTFISDSTGGNAEITTNSGATTNFNTNSTGGNAKLNTLAGGTVNFSFTNGPAGDGKISAGSIAGAGSYILGDNELTVGSNNLSTAVSGVISGVGASLVKVGDGVLSLSGASTYTGVTIVKDGTLALAGSASTTQSSGLTVELGATLNAAILTFAGTAANAVVNRGTITGQVRLGAGGDSFNGTGGSGATVLGQAGNDTLVGGSGVDTLDGGTENDTLNGGVDAVADTLIGGLGNDTYVLGAATNDIVTEATGNTGGIDTVTSTISRSLTGGLANIENLTLLNVAAAVSGTGNTLANTIRGNNFNNVLNGGVDSVVDTLVGGLGNDTYVLGAATNDIVTEATGNTGGIDTATSTISRSLAVGGLVNVENLTLLGGTAAINGIGNGLVNIITGNEGINVLDGGLLGDTLNGNGGNDVFLYASQAAFTGDTVNGGAGTLDTIRFTSATAGATLTLSNLVTQVEIAQISNASGGTAGTTALNLNALAVTAGMQLIGNNGINTITGTNFTDTLTGNAGNDILLGNAGTDTIIGGAGRDTMTGGANNDTFRFAALADSPTLALADVITDFDDSGNDTIDVGALFGALMTYRHNLAFTAAGQVRINDIAGVDLLVEVNTGGTLAADLTIRLANTTLASMTGSDFVL